jgi:hypothetical protein
MLVEEIGRSFGAEAGKWEWECREVTEGKEEEGKEVEKRRGGEAQKLVAHGS